MMLRGWHRIGVVASVLWLVIISIAYFYELKHHPSSLALALPSASFEWVADPDKTAKAHDQAKARGNDFSNNFIFMKPNYSAEGFAMLVVVPVVTAWVLICLFIGTFRWVRRGFET